MKLEILNGPYAGCRIEEKPDWIAFRREAAKDILCAMLGREDALVVLQDKRAGELEVSDAISLADELIQQLTTQTRTEQGAIIE